MSLTDNFLNFMCRDENMEIKGVNLCPEVLLVLFVGY